MDRRRMAGCRRRADAAMRKSRRSASAGEDVVTFARRRAMSKLLVSTFATLCVLTTIAFGQGRGAPPATPTIAPPIPGVVAAGTTVEVIKDGFNGTEGPIAL